MGCLIPCLRRIQVCYGDKPCGGRWGHDWILKISGIGPLWKWGIYEVIRLSGQIGSETSGSCQPCYPQGPEGWIYKQTGKVARYASLIGTKSPTKWDAQLTESNFQTHPSILFFEYRGVPWLWEDTVIRGLDYVSGAYVNADKSMYPLADVRERIHPDPEPAVPGF